MHVVYELVDPRDTVTFYVGITDDVYKRFITHLRCDGTNPIKDARIQELKASNKMVILKTLQEIEIYEQAMKREAYWIHHYHALGAPLANLVMPMIHDNVIILQPEQIVSEVKPKLKVSMSVEEQKEYIVYLLNQGLSRSAILRKIDGYIYAKFANQVIDKLMVRADVVVMEAIPSASLSILSSPKRNEGINQDRLAAVRGMISQHRSQNEIINTVFPRMRNMDAIAEYRRYLALLVESEAL